MTRIFFSVYCLLLSNILAAQEIPSYYLKILDKDLNSRASLSYFYNPDSIKWQYSNIGSNYFFNDSLQIDDTIILDLKNIFILDNNIFGDYYLDITISPYSKNYGLLLGINDTSNFYYLDFTYNNDSVNFEFYTVYKALVIKKFSKNVSLKNKPRYFLLKRNIVDKTFTIWMNHQKSPLIIFKDPIHRKGYIGFISIKNNLWIENITIWAPTSIEEKISF